VLCFLGLLVLAILALFSARYRPLAREAFDCVFRRVTLRKCTTGLDKRLKAMVTGRLVASHPGAARFLHRHLEALAWLFVVLVVGSTANLGYGFYNYYRYGNCNGPTGTGFCVFDPSGRHSRYSGIVTGHRGETVRPGDGGNPALGPAGARLTIIEFGSYTCPYTRTSEPLVREIVRQHAGQVRLVFRHFPLDGLDTLRAGVAIGCEDSSSGTPRRPAAPAGAPDDHAGATRAAIAADCAGAQGRFWEYHQRLAASPDAIVTCAGLIELARGLGVDEAAFARCLEDPAMREHVRRDFEDGVKAGIYGTPTFFIDGSRMVAPSPKELGDAVDRALGAQRR
jgi:protein-disulfide isomerase